MNLANLSVCAICKLSKMPIARQKRLLLLPDEAAQRVGICFDTCHAYSAGYDLVGDYDGVWADFDRILGIDRLDVHVALRLVLFGRRVCLPNTLASSNAASPSTMTLPLCTT